MKSLFRSVGFWLAIVAMMLVPRLLRAQQVPSLLHYQGNMAVNGIRFTGSGQFKFAIISPDGATTFWSNDGTSVAGSQPATAVVRSVNNGAYSIALGDPTLANMRPVSPTVFAAQPDLHLRVWFNDGAIGFQQLLPDRPIGSVGYAMMAEDAAGLTDAAQITAVNIPAGTLGIDHLATPGAPIAGQVLSYNGAGFVWTDPAPGGGGDSVFSLNGVNAYYNVGRVGIGTAAPIGALQVASGGLAVTGESSPYDGAGKGVFIESNPTFGGHVFAYDYTASTPRPLLLNFPGGNVGIGTPTPLTKVEIAETWDQNWSANLTLSGNRPTLMWHHHGSGPGQLGTEHYWINHMNGGDLIFYKRRTKEAVPFEDSGWVERIRMFGEGLMVSGDVTATRLKLRANPAAPADAAVLVDDPAVTTFVPFNTATSQPLNIRARDVAVRSLTITGGADLSEPFAMSQRDVPPGAVVVIDELHPGRLRLSSESYDRKVAGIVSGANGIQPGISMIQENALEAGENVALTGRVYVNANITGGRIEPGDLLTTSDVPGEAMKAVDHQRAQGAILGKAMTRLDKGRGEVLVLVTLQ